MKKDWVIDYLKSAVFIIVFYFLLTVLFTYLDGEKVQIMESLRESAILGFIFAIFLQFINSFKTNRQKDSSSKEKSKITPARMVDFVIRLAAFVTILTLTSSIIDNMNDEKVQWLATIKESIFIGVIVLVVINFSGDKKEENPSN